MRGFRDLRVWTKAHALALQVYRATLGFPKNELYGITSQMRRAAVSIAANIAEGCGREGDPEFRRFLQISMGSASELEYHLLLAKDLGMLADGTYEQLNGEAVRVKRMLTAFIKRLSPPQ